MEELEDDDGNVYNRKTYEDLKKQGIIWFISIYCTLLLYQMKFPPFGFPVWWHLKHPAISIRWMTDAHAEELELLLRLGCKEDIQLSKARYTQHQSSSGISCAFLRAASSSSRRARSLAAAASCRPGIWYKTNQLLLTSEIDIAKITTDRQCIAPEDETRLGDPGHFLPAVDSVTSSEEKYHNLRKHSHPSHRQIQRMQYPCF